MDPPELVYFLKAENRSSFLPSPSSITTPMAAHLTGSVILQNIKRVLRQKGEKKKKERNKEGLIRGLEREEGPKQ